MKDDLDGFAPRMRADPKVRRQKALTPARSGDRQVGRSRNPRNREVVRSRDREVGRSRDRRFGSPLSRSRALTLSRKFGSACIRVYLRLRHVSRFMDVSVHSPLTVHHSPVLVPSRRAPLRICDPAIRARQGVDAIDLLVAQREVENLEALGHVLRV
jgi:hypothetical protein